MRYFIIFLFAFLAGCGSTIPTIKPFKMDIQQGNVVTSKMLLQLRPGMTKSQVKFIMGSPLIIDSFHTNRWDYFYQMRRAGKIVEQRRVILDFDKELLTKVRGDVVPEGSAAAGSGGAATGNESSVAKTITVEPKPKQEKSWADKLKFWKKDEPTKGADKPTATPEKTDAPVKIDSLEANKQAPAGDAPTNSLVSPTDETAITEPNADTPSMLAVPIGGVLAPETSTMEVPGVDLPKAETPAMEAPVIIAPVVETPTAETPAETLKPVETLKPTEEPKAEAPILEDPKIELPVVAPIEAPVPASKTDERLIFRMDKNLHLQNLQTPDEQMPASKVENNAIPNAAKSKKIEPSLPVEEVPGYFERMLEKIGF